MKGKVRVKRRSTPIPPRADARPWPGRSPKSQSRQAAEADRRAGQHGPPRGNRRGVDRFGMLPDTLTVPLGTTVEFRMSGSRSSCTPPPSARVTPEGAALLPRAACRVIRERHWMRATYPSEPPGTTATLTPTLHGNGFWSTGLMDSVPTPVPGSGEGHLWAGRGVHLPLPDPPVHEGDGHRPVRRAATTVAVGLSDGGGGVCRRPRCVRDAVRHVWVAARRRRSGTSPRTAATRSRGGRSSPSRRSSRPSSTGATARGWRKPLPNAAGNQDRIPGPLIRARVGDRLRIHFKNMDSLREDRIRCTSTACATGRAPTARSSPASRARTAT